MDERDRIDDLDAMDVPHQEGEGEPIPSRIRAAVNDAKQRLADAAAREAEYQRDVVQEYEERYHRAPSHLEAPPVIEGAPYAAFKPKRFAPPSDNERKWATLAHASSLLTALIALFSAGMGVLLTMMIPLVIYFSFRKRSEYVAFHALQAFTIQLVGTIGFLVLLLAGFIVWLALLLVSILLIFVVVGIFLLPVVALLLPVMFLASLVLPLGMIIYSVIAAVESWGGKNYRIPYVGRWVESQMHTHP